MFKGVEHMFALLEHMFASFELMFADCEYKIHLGVNNFPVRDKFCLN